MELDVAILGGGFAGVYCAKRLARLSGRRVFPRVGLISETNYMVFQPLLPEVIGGSVAASHVVNPLRFLCDGVDVIRGKIRSVDWPRRRLIADVGDFCGEIGIRYRHLVLALGAAVDLSRIPGMPEHAFLIGMRVTR